MLYLARTPAGPIRYTCVRATLRDAAWHADDDDNDTWPAESFDRPGEHPVGAVVLAGMVVERDHDRTAVCAPGLATAGVEEVIARLGASDDRVRPEATTGAFVVLLEADDAAGPLFVRGGRTTLSLPV